MTVDTASAATDIGDPLLNSGGLPHDTLGINQDPSAPSATNGAPTSLDQLAAKQQADAAAKLSASLTGTSTGGMSGGLGAGLPPGTGGTGIGSQIIAAAEKYLGVPYKWGGTGATGIDCSGLIQAVYKSVGINLPRISFQQANSGKRVALNQLRPGDLVAWDNSSRNNGADHIAIYLGGGRIIEAARPGTNVRISKMYDIGQAWGVQMGWN